MTFVLIQSNPADRAKFPLHYSGNINPLTQPELDALLAAIDIPYYPLIATAVTTGERQGELLAQQWKHLDLDRKVLRVCRSLESHGGKMRIKDTKNHQARSVALFDFTVDVLSRHKQNSYNDEPDGLIFCRQDGKPLDGTGVTKSFSESLKRIGLRHVRFHDLRHTHATLLLSEGFPIKALQERLGHASAKMTLDLYGHFVPGLQDKFVRDLDSQRFFKETADEAGASERSRTSDKRFTKPLLYH